MSVEEMEMFNASISVTDLLMKTLENCSKNLAMRCISEAASRHGFDASEEIRVLGLENLTLIRKQMAKKSVGKGDKKPRERVAKEKKYVFPMPFVPEEIDIDGCQGLAYNRGLFTQCSKKRMENGNFCSGCQSESDKNASGCPDCGNVESRCATGLYEFKDPKGRSPVSYLKILDKLKLTKDAALEEAGKLNIEIPEEHFVVLAGAKEKSKKESTVRGRPKKTCAIEVDNVNDLFAKLSMEGDEEDIEEDEDKPVKTSSKQTKAKLSDDEKAAKKAALEEERAIKKAALEEERAIKKAEREAKLADEKAEREAKLADEKAEREAKRNAEAELKRVEREAKVLQEKAERDAKRAQEKLERDQKKAAEKAVKEAEKASKSKKSVAKKEPNTVVTPVKTPLAEQNPIVRTASDSAPAKVTVTRIQISGKNYLKSNINILYDPETKEEVGIWDPETKTINELPDDDDDDEVEEEDYESDA